jgi:hypothetical protein
MLQKNDKVYIIRNEEGRLLRVGSGVINVIFTINNITKFVVEGEIFEEAEVFESLELALKKVEEYMSKNI